MCRLDPEETHKPLRDRRRGRRRSGKQCNEGGKGVRGEPHLPRRPRELPPKIRDPFGRPEGLPVRRAAACKLLSGEEIGDDKGRLQGPLPEVLPEHPGQAVAFGLQLPEALSLGHHVDPVRQVPPDPLDRLVRGDGLFAQGVHGGDVDEKDGTGEEEHDREEERGSAERRLSPRKGDSVEDRTKPLATGLQGRRHDGKDPGEDPMDEGVGEGRTQGREYADLGQDAEFTHEEQEKPPDRRQYGEDLSRLDLAGRLPPRDLPGTVEEEQVGDPQIHREGHDRPAEADRQDREGAKEKRADQKRHDGPDR